MIELLSIKNFLSFKNEARISFKASKDNHLEDYHIANPGEETRLLRLGIIYGYNASGKSNFIEAFQFLKQFWFRATSNKDENTAPTPFLLDHQSRLSPSEFQIIFYYLGNKYQYKLSIYKNIVIHEELNYYPGMRPANAFVRSYENGTAKISYGSKIQISHRAIEEIEIKCLPNMSLFAALNQININIPVLIDAAHWMKNHLMHAITPQSRLTEYTENLIRSNAYLKEEVISFLNEADFNITDLKSEEIIHQANENEYPYFSNSLKYNKIHGSLYSNHQSGHTGFTHFVRNNKKDEFYELSLDMQSEGTKRVFGLSGALFESLKNNAFLCIDEIESKLHPRLIEYILERFLRQQTHSQLLLTTHYDNLFDETDLLRKDNFWFTEKDEDGSSQIYALSGFKGLNRVSSLQKAYKFGKFGAVPDIG